MSVPTGLPYVVVQVTGDPATEPDRVVAAFDNEFDAEQYVDYSGGLTPLGCYRKVVVREGGLPCEIVEVVYTKDIDDPDTEEQSRTVIAAFADPELGEAVHGHLVPAHRNVRIMVTGVKPPAGFPSGEDPTPA